MTDFGYDRETERQRYNARAAKLLSNPLLGPDGADSVEPCYRQPYLVYEQHIRAATRPSSEILDICCGDGVHSLLAAKLGAQVTASDIAEANLAIAQRRAQRAGVKLRTVVANAEELPLPDASFDLITCAGSLSYVDLAKLLAELRRLLRPGGGFIFVDSLNHNPVYRVNRYVNYLRGRRSKATLNRMPTLDTLSAIRVDFPDLALSYHGVFSFLAPVIRRLGWSSLLDSMERLASARSDLNRFAFKVVGVGHRPAKTDSRSGSQI